MNARSFGSKVSCVPSTIVSLSSEDVDHVGEGRYSGLRSQSTRPSVDQREGSQLRDSAGLEPDFPSCPVRDTFATQIVQVQKASMPGRGQALMATYRADLMLC